MPQLPPPRGPDGKTRLILGVTERVQHPKSAVRTRGSPAVRNPERPPRSSRIPERPDPDPAVSLPGGAEGPQPGLGAGSVRAPCAALRAPGRGRAALRAPERAESERAPAAAAAGGGGGGRDGREEGSGWRGGGWAGGGAH